MAAGLNIGVIDHPPVLILILASISSGQVFAATSAQTLYVYAALARTVTHEISAECTPVSW
jgi:hypothetical protein